MTKSRFPGSFTFGHSSLISHFGIRLSSLNKKHTELSQEPLHFGGILKRINRCSGLRLLAHENPNTAFLQRTESVFVGAIITDVNRADVLAFQRQRLQQPHNGFTFVPLDGW